MNVPIHAQFKYIYLGSYSSEDEANPRIWFSIPLKVDKKENTITYLFFPYGGEEEEITEISIEVPTSWIG